MTTKPNGGIAEHVEQKMALAADQLAHVDQTIRTFVKERPFVAVAGAIAFGYLLGMILSRR
jgi:ElaB/YqjD/DUF883 family membrane-anchored ribosome-binding protein